MNNELFKPFLSWTYPREVILERVNIIDELVRFILDGTYDSFGRTSHSKAITFTNSVIAYVQPTFIPLVKKFYPDLTKLVKTGNTSELVISAFKKAIIYSHYNELLSCPPFCDDELVKNFSSAFNTRVVPIWEETEPSVRGAYEKAMQNLAVSETRLISMYALVELLRQSEYSTPTVEAFEEIGAALRQRRSQFKSSVATFGSLIGGDIAKSTAMFLARDCCYKEDKNDIQYSIIHFLYGDNRNPGGWLADTEEKLRADIKKYYDKLGDK